MVFLEQLKQGSLLKLSCTYDRHRLKEGPCLKMMFKNHENSQLDSSQYFAFERIFFPFRRYKNRNCSKSEIYGSDVSTISKDVRIT